MRHNTFDDMIASFEQKQWDEYNEAVQSMKTAQAAKTTQTTSYRGDLLGKTLMVKRTLILESEKGRLERIRPGTQLIITTILKENEEYFYVFTKETDTEEYCKPVKVINLLVKYEDLKVL